MLATLPGRTQGLSLITEPLTAELHFSHTTFATLNLWASLIGALFCFPAGWIFDRVGLRAPTAAIILALAIVVAAISRVSASVGLMFGLLTLTRGFGQSALSVASITAIGKRFGNEGGMPMAVFSILMTVAMATAFVLVGKAIETSGWRASWMDVAIGLAVIAPLTFFLRVGPVAAEAREEAGLEFGETLRTPAFWIFAGVAALFNFVSSGFGLFNEAIFLEYGFSQKAFHTFLGIMTFVSLIGQFLAGYLLKRGRSFQSITAGALALYAMGLVIVPLMHKQMQLLFVALFIGTAAGMIMVVFFAIWAAAFGRRRLGRIQGAAQFLTVISSAVGPVVFAKCHEATNSYTPILFTIAALVFVVGIVALRAKLPLSAQNPA
jgi:MFS family permease